MSIKKNILYIVLGSFLIFGFLINWLTAFALDEISKKNVRFISANTTEEGFKFFEDLIGVPGSTEDEFISNFITPSSTTFIANEDGTTLAKYRGNFVDAWGTRYQIFYGNGLDSTTNTKAIAGPNSHADDFGKIDGYIGKFDWRGGTWNLDQPSPILVPIDDSTPQPAWAKNLMYIFKVNTKIGDDANWENKNNQPYNYNDETNSYHFTVDDVHVQARLKDGPPLADAERGDNEGNNTWYFSTANFDNTIEVPASESTIVMVAKINLQPPYPKKDGKEMKFMVWTKELPIWNNTNANTEPSNNFSCDENCEQTKPTASQPFVYRFSANNGVYSMDLENTANTKLYENEEDIPQAYLIEPKPLGGAGGGDGDCDCPFSINIFETAICNINCAIAKAVTWVIETSIEYILMPAIISS